MAAARTAFIFLVVIIVILQLYFLQKIANTSDVEKLENTPRVIPPTYNKQHQVIVEQPEEPRRQEQKIESVKPVQDLTNSLNRLFDKLDAVNEKNGIIIPEVDSTSRVKLPTATASPIPQVNVHKENEEVEKKALEELKRKQINEKPQEGSVEIGFKATENLKDATFTGTGNLVVYIVPHTHCDAGWLKTMEQYYLQDVKLILDSLVVALTGNPHRKFSWVEMGFFSRWWKEQNEKTKQQFIQLLKNGQIEFTMGGWVSSDEASVNYIQSINQLTLGHRYIWNEFGEEFAPNTGWQIDPFGLSQVTPSLFSQMCFDAHTAWRISEPEMKDYMPIKELEFVWRNSPSLKESTDLLMHLLPWGYEAPRAFLFEDSGAMPVSNNGEIEAAAKTLVNSIFDRSGKYRTNNLMWLWGHDFRFKRSELMFNSMDKIIDYINNHKSKYQNIEIKYSTASEYFKALQQSNHQFPMKQKDFFPYWAGPVNFWTGYYTSRPVFKRSLRQLDYLQRNIEFIFSISSILFPNSAADDDNFQKIIKVREVQGIMQHHDAITGTMREAVLNDYITSVSDAFRSTSTLFVQYFAKIMQNHSGILLDYQHAPHNLISAPTTQDTAQTISLFNSLPWGTTEYYYFYVSDPKIRIILPTGEEVPSSVVCEFDKERVMANSYKVYFEAKVPALSFKNYFIVSDKNREFGDVHFQLPDSFHDEARIKSLLPKANFEPISTSKLSIENEILKISFSETGMKSIKLKLEDKTFKITQSYWEYPSDPSWGNHYTFKPSGEPVQLKLTNSKSYRIIKTDLFEEFSFQSSALIWQTVRIFTSQSFIEVVETVGPPSRSTDIVSRYQTEWDLKNKFYTDDSGLEIVERQFNKTQQLSGNYYPTVYSTFIREHKKTDRYPNQLTFLMDTPHGVTSSQPGNLEIMIHRNNLQTLANGEALNDNTVATIRSWLLIKPEDHFNRQQFAMKLNFPLLGVNSKTEISLESMHKFKNDKSLSFLQESFPDDVFLTSFERYFDDKPKTIATRVNHLRQSDGVDFFDQYALTSKPKEEVPLKIFDGPKLQVNHVEERMLSLNKSPENCKRKHWHHITEPSHSPRYGTIVGVSNLESHSVGNTSVISLSPLAIRSFFIDFR